MPNWDIPVNIKITRPLGENADSAAIAAMFGLDRLGAETLYEDFRLTVAVGEIVAVVGLSGAGKTTLLRAAARAIPDAITLNPDALAAGDMPAVACLEGGSLKERLAILSRCGLAEATVLITPARFLSGGQLHRLALAAAIWQAVCSGRPKLLLVDEFASGLDGATAEVLAAQMRKVASRYELGMLVSTARQELLKHLQPDRIIVKGLGEPPKYGDGNHVSLYQNQKSPVRTGQCTETWLPSPYFEIERGTIKDYRALGRFHYLTGPPAAHKRVWTVRVPAEARSLGSPEVAAVLVVSPPVLQCRGRNVATGGRYIGPDRRASVSLLNAEIECISRVIVHPIYRGCGLAVRLVRHALATAATPLIEALATMGAIHPFFERGGMSAFGRFNGRRLHYNYYLAANAVLSRNSFKPPKGES